MKNRFPEANKNFGQHFLTSSSVISKITSPVPPNIDAIVEIGPGPAVLTPYLASYKVPLFVIELDERFIELLSKHTAHERIYRQDALAFNWEEFTRIHKFQQIWLVSNLPYNVSVPLTLSFLRVPEIKFMTLMYQKEVAQKILPNEPKNSMNSLHVMCSTQFDLKHIVYAPPGAFVPPPKVDSQVLGFSRKESSLIDLAELDEFEKFLRLIFGQRRKQLGGILKNALGKERSKDKLSKAQLPPEIRSEALTLGQVIKLFRC
jgi:16S rRNA (adenine1518-N6/adenine1519-N6)-dimethyltransferase